MISLETRNKHLTEALAAAALAPPKPVPQDDAILATVDAKVEAKMETVNDRITAVIKRFEAYIHKKATVTQAPAPT